MKKKLLLFLTLAFLFALTGCGEEEELAFDVNEQVMTQYTQTLIGQYYNVSEKEAEYYINDGTELEKTAVAGFRQAQTTDHVGEFKGFKSTGDAVTFKNGVDDKVLCTVLCEYENRDVAVTVSYKQNRLYAAHKEQYKQQFINEAKDNGYTNVMEYISLYQSQAPQLNYESLDKFVDSYLTYSGELGFEAVDCEVSPVYSKKELLQAAGKNTVIGMATVFCVLIFISFVISLLKFVPLLIDPAARREHAQAKEKAAQKAAQKAEPAKKRVETVKKEMPQPAAFAPADEDLMRDSELVAILTAAVYAAYGSADSSTGGTKRGPAYTASNDKLVVRSIRRVN